MTAEVSRQYSDTERTIAKSLVVALNSVEKAQEFLTELWGYSPSKEALLRWRRSYRIDVDQEIIDHINQQMRQKLIEQADSLSTKMAGRFESLLDDENAKITGNDMKNMAIAWSIFADKILGSKYAPGIQVANSGGGSVFVTFGAAPMPEQKRDERIIDVE